MRTRLNVVLWILQCLLAALFIFAGTIKLIPPAAELQRLAPSLSVGFLRFIGVAEVTGAIGLILPGLLRIRVALTPLAAACLVIIMIGATVITLQTQAAIQALFPAAVGILLMYVAYARWRVRPLGQRA
jgi:uncharacterized membrane protein YphA (DoxX/SURF4 family)